MKKIKTILVELANRILSLFDAKIVKIKEKNIKDFSDVYLKDDLDNYIINLENISSLSKNIHGMIEPRAGEELFSIAYMQSLKGDVLEIGSFQGKSTFFLGSAVKYSKNGKMIAVDHFKGNIGKEKYYIVGKKDLSDLEKGFKENIKKSGLEGFVSLINKSNHEAVKDIDDNSIRLLFIDGDHTETGVKKDLELFRNKLKKGAIIIFDDYTKKNFPGVVKVTNQFIKENEVKRKYNIGATLIVELK